MQQDEQAGFQSFPMGLALSFAFAAAGGVVWFLVSYFVNYEHSLIALGVGALAGFGFMVGAGKSNLGNGVLAAGVALGVIVLAKLAVIAVAYGGFVAEEMEVVMNPSANEVQEYLAGEIYYDDMIANGEPATDADAERRSNAAVIQASEMSESDKMDLFWERSLINHRAYVAAEADGVDLFGVTPAEADTYYQSATAATSERGDDARAAFESEMSDYGDIDYMAALQETLGPIDGLFALGAMVVAFMVAGRDT